MSENKTTVLVDEDEWVLCNDNGFVYKKKKRKREEESSTSTTTTSDVSIVDLEVELKKKRLRRRKQTLMKLKDNYNRESVHWSNLSNSLKEIEERTQNQQPWTSTSNYRVRELGQAKESCSWGSLIDDLLLQEEMREGMIGNLSVICDAAEAMCKAEEDHLKQSFFDLPVWASPRGLLASLSDQDFFSNDKNGNVAGVFIGCRVFEAAMETVTNCVVSSIVTLIRRM